MVLWGTSTVARNEQEAQTVSTVQMSFIHLVTQTNGFALKYVLCNERCVFF